MWGWCLVLLASTGCASTYEQTSVRANVSTPGAQVGFSTFYDTLSPYGQWIQVPPYGWCWTPYDVASDWRPYSDGQWQYTDYGWCWVANEPWGWAPYHYGRWVMDESYGWVWVPGTEWAPAWVAWSSSGDWVGWAPLPPSATWNASAGLAFTDVRVIPSTEWCFVPQRHLLDPGIRVQITSVSRNVTLLDNSRGMTRFEVRSGRPANLGVDVAVIQRNIGRPIPQTHIVDVPSPGRGHGQPAGGNGIGFYRPAVRPEPQMPAPAVTQARNDVPDEVLQQQRDEQRRKLESDLSAERARLAQDQANEMHSQGPGAPGAEEIQRRHAAEQQAFEAHAEQQRRVLAHRQQQQIVRPGKGKNGHPDKGNDRGKGGA
jgi:hypothetical protein